MASPSFARYAALLAGVLDGSPPSGGCADAADAAAAAGAPDAGSLEARQLDAATRRAACTLRRPSAASPRARPSSLDADRETPAAAATPPDARLDRRG